ncbi:MAG: phage holin family protein [Chloroflexi bacterium]|jgi:putative membrane protein|nr:phage holin family protein [Chloroflexota bacterium]MBA3795635.1 phage holin family protein [Chloroflexota bacterium]
MLDFLVRLVINAAALMVAVTLVPRIRFDFGDDWWRLMLVGAIFGLINSYIRPIVSLLSLPLDLFALGLVGLLVNTAMLLLLAFVSGWLALGFQIAGWPPGQFDAEVVIYAVLAALVISLVATALGLVRRLVPGA